MAVSAERHSLFAQARRRWWYWRVLVQRRGWHAAFTAAARLADATLTRRARRAQVEILRDVRYGPHPVAHTLDVYKPAHPRGPLPVLLYIHGGGFTVCSKETHRGIALAKAAGSRYLVFNINYRLAPMHRFPAAIEDACAAYRWVVEHAAEYGGDPKRIVVAGESAGGNLALGVAIAATYRRPEPYARAVWDTRVVPRAVMPVTPFLQASQPEARRCAGFLERRVVRDIAHAYLGDLANDPDATWMADPIRILEHAGRPQRRFPQVLSGVGTRDVCWHDVQRLERACQRLGIPATVKYYEGEVHAFHALRWRLAARQFWREMFGFMRQFAVPVARTTVRRTARTAAAAARRLKREARRSVRDAAKVLRPRSGRGAGTSRRSRRVRRGARAATG